MSCSKSSRKTKFCFSNALDLDIVIDNILEHLPIRIAARVSVLSKQWRRGWLSLKSLRFDYDFWDPDWTKCSSIISSILLHHNGPVHDFYLEIPRDSVEVDWKMMPPMNHSQWLSFLSKNGVRKIVIIYRGERFYISSYIFCCTTLVQLKLCNVVVDYPLTDFSGFPNLEHLELEMVNFPQENAFSRMVANCSMLSTLIIDDWDCLFHNIVIDMPSLQTFLFSGDLWSLAFRNVRSLKNITVRLADVPRKAAEIIDSVNNLANSSQLQSIKFSGEMCQCYYEGAIGPEPEYNNNLRLNHLLEIRIKGVTGSSRELKFIEYLLAVSTVLEKLWFKPERSNAKSIRKLSTKLMGLPKASKACLLEVMPEKRLNRQSRWRFL